MTDSASLSPFLFVMVMVLLLVWQVLGHIGPEYYFLHRIGRPWRHPSTRPALAAAAAPRALMVWADDGGQGEPVIGE
jgi:hypothetical protein